MKVTLEFDGNEEQDDLQVALNGYNWKSVVWDIDQMLRKTTKYQVSLLPDTEIASGTEMDIADHLRDALRKILNDYNLNLD
jgi:hypothetical protein